MIDEAPGLNGFGPTVEVVGPEIVVAGAMLDHMAGSGEDRGGEGADRIFSRHVGSASDGTAAVDSCRFCGGRPGALDQGGLGLVAPPALRAR